MAATNTIEIGDETLLALCDRLRAALASIDGGSAFELIVPDPDLWSGGAMEGEVILTKGRPQRYRSYKTWVDLAERIGCRFMTPRKWDKGQVVLTMTPLNRQRNWHEAVDLDDPTEKYGVDSLYARMDKLEEPNFALDLCQALQIAGPGVRAKVLVLGVNDGRELLAFDGAFGEDARSMTFHGVDHCASAIERARTSFAGARYRFEEADIAQLVGSGELGQYDLILSIGTLQSSNLKLKPAVQALVRKHLAPQGSIVLGFPNCRQVDGEFVYGAKMLNFSEPEMTNLVGDVHFCKRYLQQHRFRVRVFGKYYLMLVGYPLPAKGRVLAGAAQPASTERPNPVLMPCDASRNPTPK